MWSLISLILVSICFACEDSVENQRKNKNLFNTHCGSCHVIPNPKNIPKDIWKNSVLPEMGARMGYRYNGYDPYQYKSSEEKYHMRLSNAYPEQPIIDSATWWGIHEYIVSQAPDSIPIDRTRKNRNKDLAQFSVRILDMPKTSVPIITTIQYDTVSYLFTTSDGNGALNQWPTRDVKTIKQYNTALTDYEQKGNDVFVTEVGLLNPSEVPMGVFTKTGFGISDTIASNLHRPVFTEIIDLNDDGKDEYLICEFGHLTGQLSLLALQNDVYVKKSLYPVPGATNIEIADMDKDGKKDIIVLFSQGNEGIFIFYQEANLQFRREQVIKLPSEYGSSWFELIDYDSDGDLDIVMTNGDNADYSVFLKPYHGIRLLLNDGTNAFEQKWFYPIYGASRVLAADYDLDGDVDFAVTALFNNMENAPGEGFTYLENKSSSQFKFQSYTLKGQFTNGWLTMAKGDYDLDGDIDIMVGSFNVKGLRKTTSIFAPVQKDSVHLILLENNKNH